MYTQPGVSLVIFSVGKVTNCSPTVNGGDRNVNKLKMYGCRCMIEIY